jgi:DNA-binding CsgD family transcriptional regulator
MQHFEKIILAKTLIAKGSDIDTVLAGLELSHAQYRKEYPDTPITPALALDILDSRDVDKFSLQEIKHIWRLSDSQLNYALYNANSVVPKQPQAPKEGIERALKESNGMCSQTELAEAWGVSQSYVHLIAKAIGCLPANRKKRVVLSPQQWDEIRTLVETQSVDSIAKLYGISRDTVYKKLRGDK